MNNKNEITKIDDLNIEEYIIDENEVYYTNLFNIFMVHYKNIYNKEMKDNLFTNINFEEKSSTNQGMELLYEYIYEYKTFDNNYKKIYNVNDDMSDFEEYYSLILNNKILYLCPIVFPLLLYINDNLIWDKDNWKIIKIK